MKLSRFITQTAAGLLLTLAAASSFATPDRLPPLTYPFKDQTEFWVNSQPISDSELRGKPVLVMFWTYGCYNCRNSLEWINHIHSEYEKRGLIVLGVHTPEFSHEKNIDNVREKTAEYGIEFPVMIDNDFVFWKDMNNQWWPSFYLTDRYGNIRGAYIGETHLGTEKSDRIMAQIEGVLDS